MYNIIAIKSKAKGKEGSHEGCTVMVVGVDEAGYCSLIISMVIDANAKFGTALFFGPE